MIDVLCTHLRVFAGPHYDPPITAATSTLSAGALPGLVHSSPSHPSVFMSQDNGTTPGPRAGMDVGIFPPAP